MADISELFEGFEDPGGFEPNETPNPVVVENSTTVEKEEKYVFQSVLSKLIKL